MVRPHGFSPPRRFTPPGISETETPHLSVRASRACCISLPILGFDPFPSFAGWSPAPSSALSQGSPLQVTPTKTSPCRSHPSKNSPCRWPYPVTRAASSTMFASSFVTLLRMSPLPAASFRRPSGSAHPRGVHPTTSPYHRPPFAGCRWPILPGFISPSRPFDSNRHFHDVRTSDRYTPCTDRTDRTTFTVGDRRTLRTAASCSRERAAPFRTLAFDKASGFPGTRRRFRCMGPAADRSRQPSKTRDRCVEKSNQRRPRPRTFARIEVWPCKHLSMLICTLPGVESNAHC